MGLFGRAVKDFKQGYEMTRNAGHHDAFIAKAREAWEYSIPRYATEEQWMYWAELLWNTKYGRTKEVFDSSTLWKEITNIYGKDLYEKFHYEARIQQMLDEPIDNGAIKFGMKTFIYKSPEGKFVSIGEARKRGFCDDAHKVVRDGTLFTKNMLEYIYGNDKFMKHFVVSQRARYVKGLVMQVSPEGLNELCMKFGVDTIDMSSKSVSRYTQGMRLIGKDECTVWIGDRE